MSHPLVIRRRAEHDAKEKLNVDQITYIALAKQIAALHPRASIAERAKYVNWQRVNEIMARVPDVPPGDAER